MISHQRFVLGFTLGLGILLGVGSAHIFAYFSTTLTPKCPYVHQFVHKNFDCMDTDALFKEITETASLLEGAIATYKAHNEATRVSVFYRDLNSNRWFGIDENIPFAPGSLLKLPIAIAYFKLSEIDQMLLSKTFVFNRSGPSLNVMQNIKPKVPLVAGKSYTTEELIQHMVVQSDNDVVPILSNALNEEYFNKIYVDIGIYFPTSGGIEQDFVSVRTYASLLRTLYFSTYLNIENSEKLLAMMSTSEFVDGIKRGLPPNVLYASKFGDREIRYRDGHMLPTYQLHDCGIVYHPERPYILCVMTEGHNLTQLKDILAELSRIVYSRQ